jgi:hypothetical protein
MFEPNSSTLCEEGLDQRKYYVAALRVIKHFILHRYAGKTAVLTREKIEEIAAPDLNRLTSWVFSSLLSLVRTILYDACDREGLFHSPKDKGWRLFMNNAEVNAEREKALTRATGHLRRAGALLGSANNFTSDAAEKSVLQEHKRLAQQGQTIIDDFQQNRAQRQRLIGLKVALEDLRVRTPASDVASVERIAEVEEELGQVLRDYRKSQR